MEGGAGLPEDRLGTGWVMGCSGGMGVPKGLFEPLLLWPALGGGLLGVSHPVPWGTALTMVRAGGAKATRGPDAPRMVSRCL